MVELITCCSLHVDALQINNINEWNRFHQGSTYIEVPHETRLLNHFPQRKHCCSTIDAAKELVDC